MTNHIALPGKPAEVGKCIFCGNVEKMTGEHLFARWTSKAVGAVNRSEFTATLKMRDYVRVDKFDMMAFKREQDIGHANVKLNVMCADCNNVWGSGIQDRASSTLKPLLTSDIWGMSDLHREQIATWITSFIMVSQYIHPEIVCIHEDERSEFRTTTTPPRGLSVWIARYDGGNSYESRLRSFGFLDNSFMGPQLPNSCLTTMALGSLIFFVYYTSIESTGRQYTLPNLHSITLHNMMSVSSGRRKITPNPGFVWPHNHPDFPIFFEREYWPIHDLLAEIGMDQIWPTFELFPTASKRALNHQDYMELNDLVSLSLKNEDGSLDTARAAIRSKEEKKQVSHFMGWD